MQPSEGTTLPRNGQLAWNCHWQHWTVHDPFLTKWIDHCLSFLFALLSQIGFVQNTIVNLSTILLIPVVNCPPIGPKTLTKTNLTPTTTATNQVLRPSINPQAPAARKPEKAVSHLEVAVLEAPVPEDLEVDPVPSPLKSQDPRPFCPFTMPN